MFAWSCTFGGLRHFSFYVYICLLPYCHVTSCSTLLQLLVVWAPGWSSITTLLPLWPSPHCIKTHHYEEDGNNENKKMSLNNGYPSFEPQVFDFWFFPFTHCFLLFKFRPFTTTTTTTLHPPSLTRNVSRRVISSILAPTAPLPPPSLETRDGGGFLLFFWCPPHMMTANDGLAGLFKTTTTTPYSLPPSLEVWVGGSFPPFWPLPPHCPLPRLKHEREGGFYSFSGAHHTWRPQMMV